MFYVDIFLDFNYYNLILFKYFIFLLHVHLFIYILDVTCGYEMWEFVMFSYFDFFVSIFKRDKVLRIASK